MFILNQKIIIGGERWFTPMKDLKPVEGLVSFRLFGKCYWQAGGVCGFDFLRVEHPLG